MKRLLITGAAGGLGRVMRQLLAPMAEVVRLSDVADLGEAAPHEELMPCDLGDADAVMRLVEGCDGIVHFGGISTEKAFGPILNANILGVYNLYEAARAHGQPRIVFASSNHVVGFYPQTERLTAADPMRPDGLYGVSKCFGEAMAQMYFDKFGQESAIVRIGSCFPEPNSHRMLSTWFSAEDFAALIGRVFAVPTLGCPIVWGVSDNKEVWWDNAAAAFLGWTPRDSSEKFRAGIAAQGPKPGPADPRTRWQGGAFAAAPIAKDDNA
jgi:uronate dehydrogenase